MVYPYRMLVSDIDGTLTDPNGIVSAENRQAIEELRDQGIPVVLATGRTWGGTRELWEQLNLTDPVIVCNGAQIIDPVSERFLWDERLTLDEVETAASLLSDMPVRVYAVVSDSVAWVHSPKGSGAFQAFTGDRYKEVENVFQRLMETGSRPIKFFVLGDPDVIPGAVRVLREEGGLNAVQSEDYAFDILAPNTTKATALERLRERWQLSPREIVAVGNAPNDLEMLGYAGLGVAVGDAHPKVLQSADQVTVPSTQHAVAEVIRSTFPIPERVDTRSCA